MISNFSAHITPLFFLFPAAFRFKNDNELRPWQIEGVSWLLHNWYQNHGSILADEMGLVSFVVYVYIHSVQ